MSTKIGNLVLARTKGEVIWIGETKVTISDISGNRVKVAVAAPKDVKILRGELKPLDRDEVVALMESSTTAEEWNANCDKVMKDGGYPAFWFVEILESGLMDRVTSKFK